MTTLSHDRVRAQLDALFVGDDARDPGEVRLHLRACDRCREYFEHLASADAALLGDHHAGAGFARRFSDAVVSQGIRGVNVRTERSWWGRLLAGLPVSAGAVVALVALVALAVLWGLPTQDDGLQPRSALTPTTDFGGVRQLEVLCVSDDGGRVVFREADRSTGVLVCDERAEIKFLYLNKSDRGAAQMTYLAIFAFDEAGRMLWYRPTDPERDGVGSLRIHEASRLVGLGESLSVAAQHRDGRYEVYGVFTAVPLRQDAVEAHFRDEFAPWVRAWISTVSPPRARPASP